MKRVIIFPFLHSEKNLTDILFSQSSDGLDKIEILGIVPSGYSDSIKERCKKLSYHLQLITNLSAEDISSDDICIRAQGNGTKACDAFSRKIQETITSNGISVIGIEDFSWNDFFKLHSKDAAIERGSNFRSFGFKPVPIPAVAVGSMYDSYQTAEIILTMEKTISKFKRILPIFAREGLKGTEKLSIPQSLLRKLTFEDRIRYINWYVNMIVSTYDPDIILIEIPGGVLPLCGSIQNGGGEYPFIYSQALTPDYFICSSLLNVANSEKLVAMEKDIERRYTLGAIFFHISNAFLPTEELLLGPGQNLSYVIEDSSAVQRAIWRIREQGNDKCYDFTEHEEVLKWGENI